MTKEKLKFVSVLIGTVMITTFVFSMGLTYFGIAPVFLTITAFIFVCGIGLMIRQLWNWNKNYWMKKGRKEVLWEEVYLQDMYKKRGDAVRAQRYDEAAIWRDRIKQFETDAKIKWIAP